MTLTSAPGNNGPVRERGFSLLELMIVVTLIALGTGLMALALRDGQASRLEEEGVRLASLLESARAQARIAGSDVRWAPVSGGTDTNTDTNGTDDFRFTGLPEGAAAALPHRWRADGVRAEVIGAPDLRLGPEPLIGAQRVVLRLGDQELTVATDGLAPFEIAVPGQDDGTPR